MRSNVRIMAFVGLATLAGTFGVGVSPARAQGWSYGTPGYSTSPGAWAGYPQSNAWSGYAPSGAWSGYSPATVPTPPAGTAWGGYAPTPGVSTGGYVRSYAPARQYTPAPRYVPAPRVTTGARMRASTPYRDDSTGRNVFMHKPWLPKR